MLTVTYTCDQCGKTESDPDRKHGGWFVHFGIGADLCADCAAPHASHELLHRRGEQIGDVLGQHITERVKGVGVRPPGVDAKAGGRAV